MAKNDLYVSTSLLTFDEPYGNSAHTREFKFNSQIYRRLDGLYYAYLYHLLQRAEGAMLKGKLKLAAFETLYHRFAVIDEWARDRIPKDRIQAALTNFNPDTYLGPGKTSKRKVNRELKPDRF